MENIDFNWKIGGPAGFGIKTTGDLFSKTMMRGGYHIFDYVEYPSLIRGGHNVTETRVSASEATARKKQVDILIALDAKTIELHKDELADRAAVIYDGDQFKADGTYTAKDVQLLHVPLQALVKAKGAQKVMENNVALGASLAVLGMDLKILFGLIEEQFRRKGEAVVKDNQEVAQAGYDFVKEHYPDLNFAVQVKPRSGQSRKTFVTGNDAVALGAIAAGCKLYCAYPMTPASSILHTLAAAAREAQMVVRHAEDEIAVINLACGAGFAGVRTMVGTSGGGFSLMTEGLGLVGLTESPVVIVLVQRPGPATGMPTWTGQGDLRFALHAHQDDFPRIILAPGDVDEAFEMTWKAFNYAEIYQTAVIILSDKYLAESHQSTERIRATDVVIDRGKLLSTENGWDANTNGEYRRYQLTEDGIPPRAIPGMKDTLFTANSYEHTDYGYSSESGADRIAQVGRRDKKLDTFRQNDLPSPTVYGAQDAELTMVGWGSTKGPVLQAISEMARTGQSPAVNYLHLNYLWPFPTAAVKRILQSANKVVLLEGNHAAEMGGLIKQETGIDIERKYLKYDGRPFFAEEIIRAIRNFYE